MELVFVDKGDYQICTYRYDVYSDGYCLPFDVFEYISSIREFGKERKYLKDFYITAKSVRYKIGKAILSADKTFLCLIAEKLDDKKPYFVIIEKDDTYYPECGVMIYDLEMDGFEIGDRGIDYCFKLDGVCLSSELVSNTKDDGIYVALNRMSDPQNDICCRPYCDESGKNISDNNYNNHLYHVRRGSKSKFALSCDFIHYITRTRYEEGGELCQKVTAYIADTVVREFIKKLKRMS